MRPDPVRGLASRSPLSFQAPIPDSYPRHPALTACRAVSSTQHSAMTGSVRPEWSGRPPARDGRRIRIDCVNGRENHSALRGAERHAVRRRKRQTRSREIQLLRRLTISHAILNRSRRRRFCRTLWWRRGCSVASSALTSVRNRTSPSEVGGFAQQA